MSNPVLNAISSRRSIRAYESGQITKEQLDILLKAAVEAPSARNSQPWHFTAVQNKEILDDINADACKNMGRENATNIFYNAPTVIFISCNGDDRWARHDCGIAVQNIALSAHSLGLGSVILGMPEAAFTGPRGDYFSKLMKFPEGHSFAVAIAVGIPAMTKDAHPVDQGKIDIIY